MMFRGCNFFLIFQPEEQTPMKLNELSATLSAIAAQMEKAKAEIVAKIAELQAALSDVPLPADATVALAALSAIAQTLDDIVPDAPPADEPPAAG